MENACMLTTLQWSGWVTITINPPHSHLIILSIVCHETFEVYMGDIILQYDHVQVLQKTVWVLTSFDSISQHAILENLQYFFVINKRRHHSPSVTSLDMVKHYPQVSMSPLHCMHFTKSTPLLARSTNIFNTKTLSLDCFGNQLSCTYLNVEQSLAPLYYS